MVKVVSTWGNQKAKSGGMGRVFPKKKEKKELMVSKPAPLLRTTLEVGVTRFHHQVDKLTFAIHHHTYSSEQEHGPA